MFHDRLTESNLPIRGQDHLPLMAEGEHGGCVCDMCLGHKNAPSARQVRDKRAGTGIVRPSVARARAVDIEDISSIRQPALHEIQKGLLVAVLLQGLQQEPPCRVYSVEGVHGHG